MACVPALIRAEGEGNEMPPLLTDSPSSPFRLQPIRVLRVFRRASITICDLDSILDGLTVEFVDIEFPEPLARVAFDAAVTVKRIGFVGGMPLAV